MSGSLNARLVRVRIEQGNTGLIYATSPDLRGLLVAKPSVDELLVAIEHAIKDMYEACGEKVIISRVEPDEEAGEERWVAVPAEVARQSLAEVACV